MSLTRISHLLVAALVAGAATWMASATFDPSGTALRLTWAIPAGLVALAVAVVVGGWPVRRLTRAVAAERRGRGPDGWRDGARPSGAAAAAAHPSDVHRVDPLRATRVLALARACAVVGALCAGAYLALAGLTLPTAVVEPRVQRLVIAVAAVVAAVALTVAGLAVERWCRLPQGPPR